MRQGPPPHPLHPRWYLQWVPRDEEEKERQEEETEEWREGGRRSTDLSGKTNLVL